MNRFVLHGGGRAYLATGGDIGIFLFGWFLCEVEQIILCEGDIGDPYTYWAADISNKHFAYSIDVSQVLAHAHFGDDGNW